MDHGNRQPFWTARRFDAIAISPTSAVILHIIIKDKDIGLGYLMKHPAPWDVGRLQYCALHLELVFLDAETCLKTILVTGGAGFIGSHFVRHIISNFPNYRVIVLDALNYAGDPDNFDEETRNNSRFSFWWGNVRNATLVNQLVSQSDIVYHFAAESHVARSIYDNSTFYETDVLGTQTVANAIVTNSDRIERFIHISTSEVYGTAATDPMTEDHPLNPMSPYASAKAGADRLVYSYWASYDIPAVIVRPFNNYGSHQHLEKVIPRFITSALLDKTLTVHGDGSASRDWLYVGDHCQALAKILDADMEKLKGQCINLGTGIDTPILTLAEKVLERLNKPKSYINPIYDRPGQVRRHISSTDKAQKLLGWKAETSFDEGLDRTIKWYEQNTAWWKRRLWMTHVPIKTLDGRTEYH